MRINDMRIRKIIEKTNIFENICISLTLQKTLHTIFQ
jgi:hypothetical protein